MIPKRLKKGDTIGVIATSSCKKNKNQKSIENGVRKLKEWGFDVRLGKSIDSIDKYGVSAGSAETRAGDMNQMFANQDIKMIWCAWGGDTANEMLELLDFDKIKTNPKIISGFSDNTIFLNSIYKKTGLVTFHGPDLKIRDKGDGISSKYSQEEFTKRFVNGEIGEVSKNSIWKTVKKGKARGKLLGGNLSSIFKLVGTENLPNFTDSILLLEGCHTTIKDAIFQLTQLKQIGIFDCLSGLVVGHMNTFEKEEQFDKEGEKVYFEDIVLDKTKDFSFPILKINEFGHYCASTFLPIGCNAEIDSIRKEFRIIENCTE